ncbi:MAG: hypothetical protein CM1200mP2_50690 [Planctomycetaceae bacterium]|nr:MAG: hypothetical protein CM1200mP2_50690 [Planctomycetaceae bacterium]
MSWFGQKSSRATRTPRAAEIGTRCRWVDGCGGRWATGMSSWGLLMCLAAVVAMLIVVEGWKPLKPGGSVTGRPKG